MRDLKTAYQKARQLCITAGLPIGTVTSVTVNYRALRRWGQCKKAGSEFTININADLLKEANPESALMNTLIHELIHTCPNCFDHGPLWQKHASVIKAKYGYNITRVSSAKDRGIVERREYKKPINYTLKCEKCGYIWNRAKSSKFVSHPEYYRCKCGGKITRII